MTMKEIQDKMSYEEFIDWMAFYQLEPFGPAVDNLGHAITSSVIANVNRDPKNQKKPYKPEDFLIKTNNPKKVIDPQVTKVALEKLRLSMLKRSKKKCR